MKSIKDIITEYLNTNGFDGIFCPGRCSCKPPDILCCDEASDCCRPGFLIPIDADEFDDDYDFMIGGHNYKQTSKMD